MYDKEDNWSWVSTTERNHRVCGCGPRARRSYYHRRRMSSARGYCKEVCAGADFVMLGGMFAGHDECEGEIENGKMSFYGMSSEDAQLKHYGKKASHRASEGKKVYIKHKGSVGTTVEEILGGLRSACTYAGAKTLKDLPKCTTFVKVNRQLNEVFS